MAILCNYLSPIFLTNESSLKNLIMEIIFCAKSLSALVASIGITETAGFRMYSIFLFKTTSKIRIYLENLKDKPRLICWQLLQYHAYCVLKHWEKGISVSVLILTPTYPIKLKPFATIRKTTSNARRRNVILS